MISSIIRYLKRQYYKVESVINSEYQLNFRNVDKNGVKIPSVSVLSYNILADHLCSKRQFPYAKHQYLEFSYRSQRIINLIQTLNPDIICLQEVDNYNEYYQNELKQMQYELLYHIKKSHFGSHGILIGFKSNKFDLIQSHEFNYRDMMPEELDKQLSPETSEQCKRIANLLLIAELKQKETNKKFVITNTHLQWNPRIEHVKQYQIGVLFNHINANYSDKNVIVTGDFNSTPNSNQIEFVLNLEKPLKERTEEIFQELIQYEDEQKIFDFFKDSLKMKFQSSYRNYDNNIHPKFTNYTRSFKNTLDFIIYTGNDLELNRILEIPEEKQLNQQVGLPNKLFQSDHLPVYAEYLIQNYQQEEQKNIENHENN